MSTAPLRPPPAFSLPLNAFSAGNPFLGQIRGVCIRRGFLGSKGVKTHLTVDVHRFFSEA